MGYIWSNYQLKSWHGPIRYSYQRYDSEWFFSCASILINSGSYEYKIGLFTRGVIGTHGNSNKLLNDQISKQHIHVDGVYQKLNHLFNIYFRVLVCTIRLGLNKTFLKMTDDILLTRPGLFFFCPRLKSQEYK